MQDQKLNFVRKFWEKLGSNVTEMTPEHHDLVLAVTSHAPHLIAYTMVGVADDLANVTNSEVINFSAAGFRDFTRIAASDPTMWRDVFLNNRDAALHRFLRYAPRPGRKGRRTEGSSPSSSSSPKDWIN